MNVSNLWSDVASLRGYVADYKKLFKARWNMDVVLSKVRGFRPTKHCAIDEFEPMIVSVEDNTKDYQGMAKVMIIPAGSLGFEEIGMVGTIPYIPQACFEEMDKPIEKLIQKHIPHDIAEEAWEFVREVNE